MISAGQVSKNCVSAFNNGALEVMKLISKMSGRLQKLDEEDLDHWKVKQELPGQCLNIAKSVDHIDTGVWTWSGDTVGGVDFASPRQTWFLTDDWYSDERTELQSSLAALNPTRWGRDFTRNLEAFTGFTKFIGTSESKEVVAYRTAFLEGFPEINKGKSESDIALENGAFALFAGYIPAKLDEKMMQGVLKAFGEQGGLDPCAILENKAFSNVMSAGMSQSRYGYSTDKLEQYEANLNYIKTFIESAFATSTFLNDAQIEVLKSVKAENDKSWADLNAKKAAAAAAAQLKADCEAMGAIPTNENTCVCPEKTSWNKAGTKCVPEKKSWPGSGRKPTVPAARPVAEPAPAAEPAKQPVVENKPASDSNKGKAKMDDFFN